MKYNHQVKASNENSGDNFGQLSNMEGSCALQFKKALQCEDLFMDTEMLHLLTSIVF